ncbi:MAG: hypothetical protein HYS86_01595 [Candidatus Chisholmbacteria bacterium]|nr:hypothetical protein [Candidatus Chisholmbacteria bacterium]
MVLAIEAEPPFQELRDTIDYFLKLPIVLAGAILFFSLMYLDQALEDFTLMMALEADGKDPFKWKQYIESGEVTVLPSPAPGYPGYPDIDRYETNYPGLPKT